MLKSLARLIAGWVLPYQAYELIKRRLQRRAGAAKIKVEQQLDEAHRSLVRSNSVLRDRYRGRRCFVLCTGPSVNSQDLSKLKGEAVMSVSNGYHHPLYRSFQPLYHCVPQITYTLLTEGDVVRWFKEMDANLGSAELFLSSTEAALVREHKLFEGRKVRYVYFKGAFDDRPDKAIVDISKEIPIGQSVSIMSLMIAMYMGFREIYLLGTDHDQHKTGRYEYFYEPTVLKGKDLTVSSDGRVVTTRYDEFAALSSLWRQYRAIREIAEHCGVRIFNATHGGELDEYPRARFEDLFSRA